MPAYHAVPLDPHQPAPTPSSAPLLGLTPLEWGRSRNSMVAQDRAIAGRRTLYTFGLKGRDTWAWDATAGAIDWPQIGVWRRVWGPFDVSLTPGCFPRLRVLYLPSGAAAVDPLDPAAGPPAGSVRVGVSFANANNAASSAEQHFGAALEADDVDGDLPAGAGAYWPLREVEVVDIFPSGWPTATTIADFSEGTIATITIEIEGGARIVDAVLYEYPAEHYVLRHDDGFSNSAHGAHENDAPPTSRRTPGPQEARRSGGIYDERRYGSQQTLRTGARQAAKLGPHVLAWGPWASDEAHFAELNTLGEDEVEPWILAGTTTLTEIHSAAGAYSDARAGWVVAASQAQLHRYSEPEHVFGGARAVVPVRCRVRARWTGGSGYGRVRFQSSATEWIDVDFTSTTTLETLEVVGWLESQAAPDQASGVLQVFGQLTDSGHTLELYGFEIDWGWQV